MPKHDTKPHRPAHRFPTVSTGTALILRNPRLAEQLRDVFGEMRALEILFATWLGRRHTAHP